MRDLLFAESSTTILPRHRQSTLAIAAVIHIALFALVIVVKTRPVRVSSPGLSSVGIAAYVTGVSAARTAKPAEAKKTAPATTAATAMPVEDRADAGSADAGSEDAGSTGVVSDQPAAAGPVRLGSGGTLTLLKKVSPIYPSVMQSARIPGRVVLDAVIHSDGTIGDITVLQSTNEAFARAAIDAVKKWRYTPLPYEGIVTVTVNFTLT